MKPECIVFDTNVWLDYFLNRNETAGDIAKLIDKINERGWWIGTTIGICKDTFYVLQAELKRYEIEDGIKTSPAAIRETAWACMRNLRRHTMVLQEGANAFYRAFTLRELHDDLEDNLLMAVCEEHNVRMLVTLDEKLIKHCPVACLSVEDAFAFFK